MKTCAKCGVEISAVGLSPSHFARRRFCSRSCVTKGRDAWWARSENLDASTLKRRGDNISIAKKDALGTVEERFWSKVNKTNGCWLWTGSTDDHGYGMFRPNGRRGKTTRAHIWALEKTLGRPLHEGMKALHDCDNPPCVRHLYEGTAKNNADDRDSRGRANVRLGELHGRAVLTEKIVLECRARYAAGNETYKSLGEEFGVIASSICAAVKGRTWKHIK